MKKLNNTFAAVAVALGIGLTSHAHAIEMETNGIGDALLFPVFAGQFENYFTISNSANEWIQGHLRFRGAAWSAELLDFDVILSPGDVLVFRLADVDGDGAWEIDSSLDRETFQHTGMIFSCTGPSGTFTPCIESNNMLEPTAASLTAAGIENAEGIIGMQRTWGYVEFIGEAILNGMTKDIMGVLESDNPGAWKPYVTDNGNKKGTNTWRWSDAAGGVVAGVNVIHRACPNTERCDQGLLDVPNVLSGTAFITIPGQAGGGLVYNAEALIDFRTSGLPHRVNNYNTSNATAAARGRNAVILHNETSDRTFAPKTSPNGDYIYDCCALSSENRDDEVVISFNNTWGPTLADGDDYLHTSIPTTTVPLIQVPSIIPGLPATANSVPNVGLFIDDAFDALRRGYTQPGPNVAFNNSVSEIEMAIRNTSVGQNDVFDPLAALGWIRGQIFTSYYFDEGRPSVRSAVRDGSYPSLESMYLAFFPTKFYYRESPTGLAAARSSKNLQAYIDSSVIELLRSRVKQLDVQVWDINEQACNCGAATISPAPLGSGACQYVLGHELNVFDINWLKSKFTDGKCPDYTSGRTVLALPSTGSTVEHPLWTVHTADGFPGLIYTFEKTVTGGNFINWRAMQKR